VCALASVPAAAWGPPDGRFAARFPNFPRVRLLRQQQQRRHEAAVAAAVAAAAIVVTDS